MINIRGWLRSLFHWFKALLKPNYEFMADNPDYKQFAIGRFTYGRPLVMFPHHGALRIGSYCSIGDGTHILLGGNHHSEWITTYPFPSMSTFPEAHSKGDVGFSKGDVVIGNDVWLGQDVLILSGVTIGDGCVIGARSVVTKSLPPYAIAVGNPARVIKKRFSDEQIQKLLEICWWDWPVEKVKQNVDLLMSDNVETLSRKAG